MSIWNDAFEAYLEVEYDQETTNFLSDASTETGTAESLPTPKAIYVFLQFEDENASETHSASEKSNAAIKAAIANNEKRLSTIEQQYEALVAHFGQEAVEAAKRALRAHKKRTDQLQDDQEKHET